MPNDDLLDFINKNSPDKLQVEEDLGWGYVRLNITEAQRRQAKDDICCVEDALVELLRNSRDANASNIYIATWRNKNLRNIVIIDDGEGIPDPLQDKIFEPRVTSKLNKINYDQYGLHGRGMALYSISLNSIESKVILSQAEQGTIIKTVFDTNQIKEKANQSSWPKLDAQNKVKEGPNNIIKHSIAFNLKNQNIDLYLGSPIEIIQILREHNLFTLNTNTAKDLHQKATELGLETSFRNCQRIIYNEIKALKTILKQMNYSPKRNKKHKCDKVSVFFDNEDLQTILESSKDFVNKKGKEYFLKVSEGANINRVGNKLKIVLPLEIED